MTIEPRDLLLAARVAPEDLQELYSRYGFRSPSESDRNLQDVARSGSDREQLARSIDWLFEAFGSAVDPDLALSNLERYVSVLGNRTTFFVSLGEDPSLVELMALVFGGSPFLTGVLIRNPEYLSWLRSSMARDDARQPGDFLEGARAALASTQGAEQRLNALRRYHRRELLRIGAGDLRGDVDVRIVTNELSWLADAVLQGVFEETCRRMGDLLAAPPFEFGVIGVGKLGGEELNFSSDIDIFYIYSHDAQAEFAQKLARRMNNTLTERTSEGAFYRVDLRLRPEGSRGAMATSLRGLTTYYDSWGETFERLALSKARFVAGHRSLEPAFNRLAETFVYRKYLDYAAIDEVRDIKRRIDRQVEPSGGMDLNVKLGWGGIREIEFFVQALQILYGGEKNDLRVRSTLESLSRLENAGLIEGAAGRSLGQAYVFLRNVEHKLQIVDFRQTHDLPTDPDELEKCARRMKMPIEDFRSALKEHRSAVHTIFDDLFASRTVAREGLPDGVHRFVNGGMEQAEALEWLEGIGFEDPRQAYGNLVALRDAPAFGHSPTRVKNLLSNVLPQLLRSGMRMARSGKVLNGFERVTLALGAREAFFRSLLENPRSIPRIAQLFSVSDYLSETLFRVPGAVDFIIDESRLAVPLPDLPDTRSRRVYEFYVGAQQLFGIVSRKRVSRSLTRYAERELRRFLSDDSQVAVFALGKFGERELNYRSDLDVIAFYEGDYQAASVEVRKLVAACGEEFKIDLRLRPEGNKGSIVWDGEKTATYLRDRAETWERMAWTKARFVAGSSTVRSQIDPLIEAFVYEGPFGTREVAEMKHIRGRMERELARETNGAWDLKLGRGGLVDLEFLAQFVQIRRRIRIPNTALVLQKAGMPDALVDDYHFLRRVESMLRLWSSRAGSRIEQKDVAALETMLGIDNFTEAYRETTTRIRAAFDQYRA